MYCCFLDVGCFVQLNGWMGSFVLSSDTVDSLEGYSHNCTGILKKKKSITHCPRPRIWWKVKMGWLPRLNSLLSLRPSLVQEDPECGCPNPSKQNLPSGLHLGGFSLVYFRLVDVVYEHNSLTHRVRACATLSRHSEWHSLPCHVPWPPPLKSREFLRLLSEPLQAVVSSNFLPQLTFCYFSSSRFHGPSALNTEVRKIYLGYKQVLYWNIIHMPGNSPT